MESNEISAILIHKMTPPPSLKGGGSAQLATDSASAECAPSTGSSRGARDTRKDGPPPLPGCVCVCVVAGPGRRKVIERETSTSNS